MRTANFFPTAVLALALAAASAGASANTVQADSCSIHSDYDLTVNERSVIMTRKSGEPKALVMRQGRLFVDDRWVQLSAADRKRIAAFERGTRQVLPLAQTIGRDAADIAFSVLGEVAAGFSSDPAESRVRMAQARRQLDARLARSVTATRFDGEDLGDGIGDAVGAVVPELVGNIVGGAIRAAFKGDVSKLQGLQNLDSQIEARVEPRAAALEQRVDQLCARMVELDKLENALEYRLPDGSALDLIDARQTPRKRRNRTGI
ncbi:MAG: YggN family protein [Pseudomonadota bacterium]|nr:YggN family protein [Pseudomonadota bacterium]